MNKIQNTSVIINRPYINPVFSVKTNSLQIANTLTTVYSPFSAISGQYSDGFQISAMQKDNTIILQYGKTKIACPVFEVTQRIINIIYELSKAEEGYTLLHAAAVAIKDKAFILAGKTQAGKSTLTAYLCSIGFEYITDDITIVDNKNCKIIPYRKRIMLRDGSRQLFKNNGINISMDAPIKWGDELRYPFAPATRTNFSSFKLEGVFFIKWNKNKLKKTIDLPSGNAFIRLLSSGLFYAKSTPSHLEVIKNIISTGCYDLNYSSLNYVANLLKERAGNG